MPSENNSFEEFEKTVKKEMKKAAAVGTVAVAVLGTGMARETLENHSETKRQREADIAAVRTVDTSADDIIDLREKTDSPDENPVEQVKTNKVLSYFCSGLYVIFWFAIKVAVKVLSLFSAPIIHFVLLCLGVFLAVIIGVKVKYTDVPLRKLLSKKTLKRVFVFTVILFALSTAGEIFIPDFEKYIHLGELAIGVLFSLFIVASVKPKKKKKKYETVTVIDVPDGSKIVI